MAGGAKYLGGAIGALLTAVSLVSCGGASSTTNQAAADGRSVDALCSVWRSEGLALHDRYVVNSANPLALLVDAFGVMNDLAQLYGHMAEVAPSDIRGDLETVRDAFKSGADNQAEMLSNPVGALGKNFTTALSSSGASGRVDSYISSKCGIPVSTAVGATSSADSLPLPNGVPLAEDSVDCNGGGIQLHIGRTTKTLVVIDVGFPSEIDLTISDGSAAPLLQTTLNPLTSTGPFRFPVVFAAGDWNVQFSTGFDSGNMMAPNCDASLTIYPTR